MAEAGSRKAKGTQDQEGDREEGADCEEGSKEAFDKAGTVNNCVGSTYTTSMDR